MCLLWAYEHDFTAISLKELAPSAATRPGLSGSSRGPLAGALGELRVTVRASPLSVGTTDLLLLTQQTSHPVPRWFRPAFNSVRGLRIGCRSQHQGMGLRRLRMKVRRECPPRVLSEEADPVLVLLCPVRALRIYVDCTRSFRSSEQFFVCHGAQQKGKTVSKQRLTHWIVDAITL